MGMVEVYWVLFVLTSLLVIATPGQDMILVMSRSVAQGAAAGVATAAGVSVGLLGHTVLVTLGLGAVLRASEWLFLAFKLIGAAYLIYLGIGLLRTKSDALLLSAAGNRSRRRLFLDGAFSNIANPKIAVFYFAFLPQFVQPSAAHPTVSVFVLGVAFAALTFLVKGPVGLFSGMLSAWLRSRPSVLAWLYRSSGAILVALGLKLAFERRP
jgi:threonine/homoserine/homoserine lactone efflux protein